MLRKPSLLPIIEEMIFSNCRRTPIKGLFLICISAVLFAAPVLYAQEAEIEEEAAATFHGFSWGTSEKDFIAKMGRQPEYTDEADGLKSFVYDKLIVSGFQTFMVAFFSSDGLEGGSYYFNTFSNTERTKCYNDLQKELVEKYGEAHLFDKIYKEPAPYMSSWSLESGYIMLKIDTRKNDPVTLWFSSPKLTKTITG